MVLVYGTETGACDESKTQPHSSTILSAQSGDEVLLQVTEQLLLFVHCTPYRNTQLIKQTG
jgi:hypothetical protein